VRLILDEHYSPEIARRLRAKGHDVAAVAERADLVGLGDEELFRRMALEERAIMTNSVKDFVPLAHRAAVEGRDHSGLLLTSDKRLPRRLDVIGRTVDALDEFLSQHHDKDSCRNRVRWLGAARP
jgi:predicted nuclease of predicted toxin-antitoxin system